MTQQKGRWLLIATIIVLLLTGCGQLEVGIEAQPAVSSPTAETVAEGAIDSSKPTPLVTVRVPTQTPTPTTTTTSEPIPSLEAAKTAVPNPTLTIAPVVNIPTLTAVPLPHISRFSVSPIAVEPEDELLFSWEATGDQATVCIFQTGYVYYSQCLDVPLVGAQTWQMPERLRDDFAVELQVFLGEETVSEGVGVSVDCPDTAEWWFFTPAPVGCPSLDATSTQAAAQHFQRGWMLWLEAEDSIYVFFDDGTYAYFSQFDDDAEIGDGGVVAPEGLVAPIRGFGQIWRGEAESAEGGWVRNALGWGVEPEFGYQTQYQWDALIDRSIKYIRDPDGRILRLDPYLSPAQWQIYSDAE